MNDPMGQAMMDYLHDEQAVADGGSRLQVHSDIARIDEIPVPYLFRDWKEMPEIERRALTMCSGKVLDIGAGAGSHALWMQERGLDVTAIDTSEGAVEVMKARGVENVVRGNVLDHSGSYDTLLLMMNGIGIAGDIDGLRRLLSHFRTILSPGGKIIFDSSDIRYMFEEEDGSFRIDLNNDYYGVVEYQFEYNGKKGDKFNWIFVDYITMNTIASEIGLDTEMIMYGGAEYLATSYFSNRDEPVIKRTR